MRAWTRDSFSLRTDSDFAQLALIRAGCGLGMCQVELAKRDPSLVRVLSRHYEFKLQPWVVVQRTCAAALVAKWFGSTAP